MNYFVEGIQGSGKSTMVMKLSEKYQDYKVYHEGDYCPVELAWCTYMDDKQYSEILEKYDVIKDEIIKKTVTEGNAKVVRYTQIITDIPGFHKYLEQYEIYNGRVSKEDFKNIVLSRFERWNSDGNIFECSLFQNIVEDMILFGEFTDEEILDFYREVKKVLDGKNIKIVYLESTDIEKSINAIKKERSDADGNELWFPVMLDYFSNAPYSLSNGLSGFDGLIKHLTHRQSLELRICKELFSENTIILKSKEYDFIP